MQPAGHAMYLRAMRSRSVSGDRKGCRLLQLGCLLTALQGSCQPNSQKYCLQQSLRLRQRARHDHGQMVQQGKHDSMSLPSMQDHGSVLSLALPVWKFEPLQA